MRVWIAALILLGLAIVLLALAPRAIDWNDYRSDIEAAAIRLSGHEVTIGGPIEISLLPHPVMTARDVTMVGDPEDATGFTLAANQAEMIFELGPLLAGRPVVRDLRLRRPVLTVHGEASERVRSWPPRWQDWAGLFLKLDLEAIGITDGKIEIVGDRRDRDISLNDLSLELQANQPDGPLQAAGLFKTARHRFTMSADVSRPDREGFSAAKLSIDAKNGVEETTALRFSGRAAPFADDQDLRGRLTLSGPDLQYGLAALSAATGYPATFRSIAGAQPFSIEGRIEADRSGIRADDLQLTFSEKRGKGRTDLQLHPKTRLDLDIDLPTFRLADDTGLGDFLPLDLLSTLQVPPGEIDIGLREVLYRDQAFRQAGLTLKTGADGVTVVERARAKLPGLTDVQFEGGLYAGDVGPRLRGRLEAVGDDLKSSLVWLDLIDEEAESRGWRSFSLTSDVEVTSVEIALLAIDMRLDSAKLSGKAGLRFSERQQLTLDVDVDRPNLDLYLAGSDAMDVAAGLAAGFEQVDAEVEARFDRLTWQGLHVEEGSISASADEGKLTLRKIDAKTTGETTLALDGMIDLDGRTIDLNTDFRSQHPIRALRHFKLSPALPSGRLEPLALSGKIDGNLERFALNLEAGYDGGEASIEGEAGWASERPWYDLAIRAAHPDHQTLASQIGLAPLVPAGDARGPLDLAGRLRYEAGAPWTASGNVKLGPTSFTGSLTYQDEPLISPFEARLSIGTPKRDSLAPLLILGGLRLTGDWTPARWLGRLPTVGLRTAWLEKAEGSLSLASKGGLVGDGLEMEASLENGLLHVARLEASPWQGRLLAEMTLERRRDQPSAAIAVDLTQVESADFAKWLGVQNGIEGPLDLRLEASTTGTTPFELMAGLAGDIEIEAGPGEIEGLGVPVLRKTLASGSDDGDSPADRSLSIPFGEIDAKAALSRGVLTFEDSRLVIGGSSGDATNAEIEGTADLLLWMVDLSLRGGADEAGTTPTPDPKPIYRLVGPPDRPSGFVSTGN